MPPTTMRIGELLVAQRLLTQQQLDDALSMQRKNFRPLGEILVERKSVSEEQLLNACAMQKGVRAWHLQHSPPVPEAISLLSAQVCRDHMLLPVQVRPGRVVVAMTNPLDVDALDMVSNITKLRAEPVLVGVERLIKAINDAYGVGAGTRDNLSRLMSEALSQLDPDGDLMASREGVVSEAEMRPVVSLVHEILIEAVRRMASDVHFEPRKDAIAVRYRIDGQMIGGIDIPKSLQAAVVARLKIMSQLDIVEYRIPQDGRLSFSIDGRPVDMRISVLPSYHGQRLVLRILDRAITLRTLAEVGLSETNRAVFHRIIRKPCGLVLVTGPTGSGKTTTLYATVNQLKSSATNIMTCEDPVEYEMEGISQSQVNEKVGLTFAAQLRSILRQDPDIILVGEIRDKETADTAIQAALTGHLVLSTLHCNDATAAIPRLTDMGVDPMMISSALVGVTAQRLVRQLCPYCKENSPAEPEEVEMIGQYCSGTIPHLWRAVGCERCDGTGYIGRLGLHEIIPVTSETKRMIALGEPMDTIRENAARQGFRSIQEDAIARLLDGVTSYSEVARHIFFENTPVSVVAVGDRPLLRAA